MGDPASIGPEITVKAFADPSLYELCCPLVVGDAGVMEAALSIVNHKELQIHRIQNVSDALFRFGTIDVLDMGLIDVSRPSERTGICGMWRRCLPLCYQSH